MPGMYCTEPGNIYTHANKKKATPIHRFCLIKYRHEHVMITKLYIVSHILYDHHIYEYIL